MKHWNERGTGLLLCLCIAIPCWMLGRALPVIGGPVFAILAGMAIALLVRDKGRAQAGIAYTSKTILQYAVILLGFGLNLSEVAKVGVQSLPIILSTITTSLVVSFLLHRLLHIPSNISTLVGVGSSVCGGSAIAATAPVIGADDECSATSFLRNWDSILEKKRANLRSISEPARLRQPPPQKHGSGTRKRAGSKHTGGATNTRPSRAFCPLVG